MEYIAEIYEGEADAVGTPEWELPYGWLPGHVAQWAEEHGRTPENPDTWLNIVPAGTWAPNNRPDFSLVFECDKLETR